MPSLTFSANAKNFTVMLEKFMVMLNFWEAGFDIQRQIIFRLPQATIVEYCHKLVETCSAGAMVS